MENTISINTKQGPLMVLGLGTGWMAVDKPANLSVHNNPGEDLLSILLLHLEKDHKHQKKIVFDLDFGVHPAHRLDKETSGVILLSTRKKELNYFARQFELNKIEKRYLALVHGLLNEDDKKNGIHGNTRFRRMLVDGKILPVVGIL